MLKQINLIILSVIFLFVIIPSVLALDVPSQTRTINGGCEILTPDFTVLKQNADFTFYFHVYNQTSFVNNNSANCTFHLYSTYDNGKHILRINDVPFLSPRDFFAFVNGSTNLSQIGRYSYLFECGIPVEHIKTGQNNACGIEGEFEVTTTGQELTTAQSGLSIGILGSILLLMFFFGWLSFKFMETDKAFPIGVFFMLVSIIIAVYGLYLGVVYSRDYLYASTSSPQSAIFIGILYGLIAVMFLGLLGLVIMALKEIKERKSIQQHGTNYNTHTKQYEY